LAVVYWIRAPHQTSMLVEGYVGVTSKTSAERFKEHAYEVSGGSDFPVHNAMRKYGSTIVLETLVEGSSDYCYLIENSLRPEHSIGWNLAVGGSVSPMLGRKHTPEVLADLSIKQAGQNNGFYGKTHSEDFCEAQRQRRLGAVATEATRQKLSEAMLGSNNHFFGKTHSDETRKQLSASLKALPEEVRQRVSSANAMRGAKHTEETRQKMRDAAKTKTYGPRGWEPWEHPRANAQVWARADEIYGRYIDNPSITPYKVSKDTGMALQPVSTIIGKIKAGWNPTTDSVWVLFKGGFQTQE
jgi:hypothetical protein